eukprot:c15550_g1_i2 orf=148-579(-)
MNKPGAGGAGTGAFGVGLGGGAAAGPTVAAVAAAAQRQRSLLQRADADITSLLDNFSHLLKAARVQAADSLLKLVSELKQTAVFSDFKSLTEQIKQRVGKFEKQSEQTESLLCNIGEQAAVALKELENHYYLSLHKNSDIDSS